MVPRVLVRCSGRSPSVSWAGSRLLVETARLVGLDAALSVGLAGWRRPRAAHDPGKIVLDLAIALAAGGDCPADVAMLRARPGVFGSVASEPTVSRLMDTLAADPSAALGALRSARASARARGHALGDAAVGDGEDPPIVDFDGTLVEAYSAKEGAAPTFKRGFGFHPLLAYLDHGAGGTGEPLAGLLRPGNANSTTAADHLVLLDLALAQLDPPRRSRMLVRIDAAGASHRLIRELTERGLGYSIGFPVHPERAAALAELPENAWRPAVREDGSPREHTQLAEATHLLRSYRRWPSGMRLIAKRTRAPAGAQLRLGDLDGWRITCLATNSTDEDIAALELRHRRRARCEDRIRAAKDTGLANLPYKDFASNAIWLELVLLAQDLLAFTQTLALTGEHRRAEPKRLRLRLFAIAARLVRTGRRRILDLDPAWPWVGDVLTGIQRLHALAPG